MLGGYADEHVKSAIVEGLRRRGMDVVTVIHDDDGTLPDDFYGSASGWNTLGQYAQHSGFRGTDE